MAGRPVATHLLRRLHVDAPLEPRAVLEDHARCRDVTADGPRLAQDRLLAGEDIAVHLTLHDDHLAEDVGFYAAVLADGHIVLLEVDPPLDPAFDDQVLFTAEIAFDEDRRADRGALGGPARRLARGRRGRRGRRRRGGRGTWRGRLGLWGRRIVALFRVPSHETSPSETIGVSGRKEGMGRKRRSQGENRWMSIIHRNLISKGSHPTDPTDPSDRSDNTSAEPPLPNGGRERAG